MTTTHETRPTRRRLALAFAALTALAAAPVARAKAPAVFGPIVLAAPKDFASAIRAIEKATGSKAMDLELKGNPLPAGEGRAFNVEGRVATRLLEGSHEPFLKAGLYLFRLERSFGMGGGLDVVALVKTTSWDGLIRRVGTSDPHGTLGPDQIVEWLTALAAREPFTLDEIGTDYLAGHFKATPKDPAAVARHCAEFAPELVKGGTRGLEYLTEEIKADRTLYLIW